MIINDIIVKFLLPTKNFLLEFKYTSEYKFC